MKKYFFLSLALVFFVINPTVFAGTSIAWGRNNHGQCDAPVSANIDAIDGGDRSSLALMSNGSLIAWGRNNYGQGNVPDGIDFAAIAAGYGHSVALRSDGSMVAWGLNNAGQCNVPAGHNWLGQCPEIMIQG